jgi:hypothetical protein
MSLRQIDLRSTRILWPGATLIALLFAVGAAAMPQPAGPDDPVPPALKTDNTNALLKEYRGKVKVTASTFFGGWPPEKVLDGDLHTSWFTATGDAAAKGTKPWIELELPQSDVVRRVTILGNREPSWPTGYSILAAKLELFDKDRKLLWADESEGAGKSRDFDFRPKTVVKNVRYIRFTSLKDEGDKNPFDDVAIAEILAE